MSPEPIISEFRALESKHLVIGCWCVISEFYADGAWHHSDSVGFCTGYENPLKPEENFYVVDLMRAAIDSLNRPEPV